MLDWILAIASVTLWIIGFGTYIFHARLGKLWHRLTKKPEA